MRVVSPPNMMFSLAAFQVVVDDVVMARARSSRRSPASRCRLLVNLFDVAVGDVGVHRCCSAMARRMCAVGDVRPHVAAIDDEVVRAPSRQVFCALVRVAQLDERRDVRSCWPGRRIRCRRTCSGGPTRSVLNDRALPPGA